MQCRPTGKNSLRPGSTITLPNPLWTKTSCWTPSRPGFPETQPSLMPVSQPSQLDPVALERLRRLGGEEFTRKMIDLFLSYSAQKIGEARRALEAANLDAVAKAAHPVRSSAGNVGAVIVQ